MVYVSVLHDKGILVTVCVVYVSAMSVRKCMLVLSGFKGMWPLLTDRILCDCAVFTG